MYPEKRIHDIAGFPAVRGRELVDRLLAQAEPFGPRYLLGHRAEKLEPGFTVTTHQGTRVSAKAVIVTGGIGTFTPRPLPAADHGLAPWHGRLLLLDRDSASESTGHGSPLPHTVHGGPGRAGGGEELGGIRGVLHHMQRTALQGSPDVLRAVTSS